MHLARAKAVRTDLARLGYRCRTQAVPDFVKGGSKWVVVVDEGTPFDHAGSASETPAGWDPSAPFGLAGDQKVS